MKTLSSFTHPRHSKPIRILYIFKTQIMTILKNTFQEISVPPLKLNWTQTIIFLTIFPLLSQSMVLFLNQPHLACLQVYKWGFNAAFNLLQIWCLIPLSTAKDACGCILVTYLLGRWCSHLSRCISDTHLYCEYSTPIINQQNKSSYITVVVSHMNWNCYHLLKVH